MIQENRMKQNFHINLSYLNFNLYVKYFCDHSCPNITLLPYNKRLPEDYYLLVLFQYVFPDKNTLAYKLNIMYMNGNLRKTLVYFYDARPIRVSNLILAWVSSNFKYT